MAPPPSLTRQVTRLKIQKYIYLLSYCAGITNTTGGTGGEKQVRPSTRAAERIRWARGKSSLGLHDIIIFKLDLR
jgi:hypothetical protein